MPLVAEHLVIAKKYLENLPGENDSIKFLQSKVDLKKYLISNTLDTSFNRGYFLHLIFDLITNYLLKI